jgi:hypothetical protein
VDIEHRGDRATAASADSLAFESRLRRPTRRTCVLTLADVVRDEPIILRKKIEDARAAGKTKRLRTRHIANTVA